MSAYYELRKPWEPELIGVKDGLSQAAVFEKGFKDPAMFKEFMRVFADPNYFSSEKALASDFELECVK
jgi:hypothetical protein